MPGLAAQMTSPCEMMWHAELRKYMLGDGSFWHTYLEMLPETDDIGASFTWKDQDLELLSGAGGPSWEWSIIKRYAPLKTTENHQFR